MGEETTKQQIDRNERSGAIWFANGKYSSVEREIDNLGDKHSICKSKILKKVKRNEIQRSGLHVETEQVLIQEVAEIQRNLREYLFASNFHKGHELEEGEREDQEMVLQVYFTSQNHTNLKIMQI